MTLDVRGALTFGIYPGSAVGGTRSGPPDRPERIIEALHGLQGVPGRPFVVRAYETYTDPCDTVGSTPTPSEYDHYLGDGRALDLVAQYHSQSGDIGGYCEFIEALVGRHGSHLGSLQVAEEPNITTDPTLDGAYPRVTEAVIAGVHAAKAAAHRHGHPEIKVGCNTSPLVGPAVTFLAELTREGGSQFIADLDYIGLDFFPDVFRPISPDRLAATTRALLDAHRHYGLQPAGLGHLPLVITEHGWPTGPDRPAHRQAEVLETVIDVLAGNAAGLNITGYTHHALRDTNSARVGLLNQFGLMTDDYTAKPAFHTYRHLIGRLAR